VRPDGLTSQLLLHLGTEQPGGLLRPRSLLELHVLHRPDRLDLADRRGQKGLAPGEQVVQRAGPLLHVEQPRQPVAGDRREDVLVQRRRAEGAVAGNPEERRGGRLEHAPVRRHEQRLVEAALAREPAAEHVGAVGERLDPVQHARGRVLDHPQPDALRSGRQRLGEQQPVAAAGQDDPEAAVELRPAALREQLGNLALQLAPRHVVEPKVRRRTLEPVEMVGERERAPVVDPDDLERAIAAQEPLVGGGNGRLARRHEAAVDAGELGRRGGSSDLV
jgi:hypothetical protein